MSRPWSQQEHMVMRRRVAAAGVTMQAGLGTAYAWSVFRNPLAERFGWSLSEVSLSFSLMILTAGFAAFIAARSPR